MDRRSFLKKGLFGGAVLALGGTGLAFYPTLRLAEPRIPLLVLDDRAFQVLVAIAGRIAPADADPVAIAHGADQSLLYLAAPEAREDLKKLFGVFENALPGALLDFRAAPFTRLGPEAQDRVLASWRDSRLSFRRGAYQVLRKLCLGRYYLEETSWPGIHYPGPPPDLSKFVHEDSKAGTPAWLAAQKDEGGAR